VTLDQFEHVYVVEGLKVLLKSREFQRKVGSFGVDQIRAALPKIENAAEEAE
jgi:hypothetical protein